VPVVEGRNFEPTDVEGPPVALVNQTLARAFFPGRSPINRRFKPGGDGPWVTIVGVLGDVKQRGLGAKTGTELYLLNDQLPRLAQFAYTDMNIVLRTSLGPEALAGTIQQTVRSVDPTLPVVKLRTMEEVFAESLSRPRFLAQLLGVFAALALLLAAVGIYGVLSYLVTERQQEIGVRMALGAERRLVLGMILQQGLALTLAGLVLGVAGALALTRVLQSLLFGVKPADPAALATGVVCISLLGALACFVPARRATRVDPVVVLRAE
jgi:predicted permease